MARPAPSELDETTIQVPRAVKLPVELTPPEGFDPGEPATWPAVEGCLPSLPGLAPHVGDLFRQIGVRAPTPGGPR
jgi:hypothetical protein